MNNKLSIVVPVYNEENNIKIFLERLKSTLNRINIDYEIIFALDPSSDNTEKIILDEIKKNNKIKLIIFSRRFGQPAATMAGIQNATGNRCVIIDCDLQDPPELIYEMNKKIDEGFDAVLARRSSRKGETFIKKIITKIGYSFIEKITDIKIPKNTGDFRIISKKILDNLKKFKEPNAFLRGLVAYIGFNQTFVEYDRDERVEDKSKYNKYIGSIQIAFNGIFGFSSRPLFIMSLVGFFFAFISFIIGLYYIVTKFIDPQLTPGLSSTILFISFFSGINLIGLGVLGEYVGRIYDEVKGRPEYIIDKKFNFDE
ncbi:glycosyltransferase family 2 protein [Candidatus Pelagibacter sp.]|nr:glycosyltransferase family 2 protein [Candidatus Pelagibacter sp.]